MIYDYNAVLRDQIYALKAGTALEGISFIVDSEQAFMKKKDFAPDTVYVLTRSLQNDNGIGVDTQPIQILILTEQNSLEVTKEFFSEFAKKYNFQANLSSYEENGVSHTLWVKQQYSDPVVLSNFNMVAYGYRSVLYISATLYIMKDVVDLRFLTIDGQDIIPLSFDLAYSMNPNTQQMPTEFIARSIKSVSTLAITITIPVVSSDLTEKVFSIMNEIDAQTGDGNDYGGNEDFVFSFSLGAHLFADKRLKLVTANFAAAVNDIPVIRLGFIK